MEFVKRPLKSWTVALDRSKLQWNTKECRSVGTTTL